ncbi:hypothetical protein D9M69_616380 [compost metagenome]
MSYCRDFVRSISEARHLDKIKVVILSLNDHPDSGDLALCQYVYNELSSLRVDVEQRSCSEHGVLATWNTISNFDAYISVRLHGAVSAFLLGVPFLLYEYHPKCSEFLNDIGMDPGFRLQDKSRILGGEKIVSLLTSGSQFERLSAGYISRAALNFSMAPWAEKNS